MLDDISKLMLEPIYPKRKWVAFSLHVKSNSVWKRQFESFFFIIIHPMDTLWKVDSLSHCCFLLLLTCSRDLLIVNVLLFLYVV